MRQHPETMWMPRPKKRYDPEVGLNQARCTNCGIVKDRKADFYRYGYTDRYRQPCKVCALEKNRSYRKGVNHD